MYRLQRDLITTCFLNKRLAVSARFGQGLIGPRLTGRKIPIMVSGFIGNHVPSLKLTPVNIFTNSFDAFRLLLVHQRNSSQLPPSTIVRIMILCPDGVEVSQ